MSEPDLRLIGECIHIPAKAREFIHAEVDLARADPDLEWRRYLLWRATAIALLCERRKAPEGFWKQEAERRLAEVFTSFALAYDAIQHRAGLDEPGPDFGRREGDWRYTISAPGGGLQWSDIPPGWGKQWRPKSKPRPDWLEPA